MNLENISSPESLQVTKVAKAMGDAIILSIGDPHFSTAEDIVEKTFEEVKKGKTHYVDPNGIEELREAVVTLKYKKNYSKEEILITPGAKQGIFYLLSAIKGKKVCVLEPAWLGYRYLIEILAKEYDSVNFLEENWKKELEKKEFDILIVNIPSNPSGKILTKEEVQYLINLSELKGNIIISDEIYDYYDYKGEFVSFSEFESRNIVVVNGLSKSHAMTGWRIGYLVTKNLELLKKVKILNQHIATCVSSISQEAALIALNSNVNEEYKDYYKKNLEVVREIFPELGEFHPKAGLYYFVNLEKFKIKCGSEFSKKLLESKKVAVVPGEAYGHYFKSWIRISISIKRPDLIEGIKRIKSFLNNYNFDGE